MVTHKKLPLNFLLIIFSGILFLGLQTLFANDSQIESFIKRLYSNIYEREADQGGLEYWKNQLKSGHSATEVAKFFYKSPEMKSLNLSDEEFLKRTYRTFFDREPDQEGYNYWLDQMKNKGIRRDQIFYGFALSPEFERVCNSYGVRAFSGEDKRRAYIERFYNLIMQRDADEEGVNYWLKELEKGEKTPSDIAKYFFFSPEFINKHLSNKDFVTIAYRTLLNRDPDSVGLSYWVGELDKGVSREKIIDMFLDSNEFKNITKEFLETSQEPASSNTVSKAPSNLKVINLTTNSITLSWKDNSNNEKGFRIYREDGKERAYKLIATLPPNTTSYKDSGLKANTPYSYQIRSFNDMGTSPVISLYTVTLAKAPYDVYATSSGCYEINIRWKAHSIFDEFNIYRDGKLIGMEARGAINHSYWDSLYDKVKDPCNKKFTYTIKAVNRAGVENSKLFSEDKINGGVVVTSVTAHSAPPPTKPDSGNTKVPVSGTVIDDPVANLPYICGDGSVGKTDGGGNFECPASPVTFKIGGLIIGHINKSGRGLLLDLRDLAGVDDPNSPKVVNLAVFLQSLDETSNDKVIKIPDNINVPAQSAPLSDLSLDKVQEIIQNLGKTPIDSTTAKNNFIANINDTTPPNPPTVTGNPGVTNQNIVTVTINGEDGATVYVNGKFVSTLINGSANIDLNLDGGDGIKRFVVTLKDPAGNESDALNLTITKDTTPPNIPIIQGTVPQITNQDSVNIIINGEEGSEIFVNGVSKGVISGGSKEISLDTSGTDGDKNFAVTLKDPAGNESQPLNITIKKDATPPAIPTLQTQPPQATNQDSVNITINGEEGSEIFVNGVSKGVISGGSKEISLDTSGADGDKNFAVTLKDPAGNESQPLNITIKKDTTPPAAPIVRVDGNDVNLTKPFATQQNSLNVEIVGEADSKLMVNGEENTTLTNGSATIVISGYSDNPNNSQNIFRLKLVDLAGNESNESIFKPVFDISVPVFVSPNQVSVQENNDMATIVVSTDPGGTQRYTIIGGADQDKFHMGSFVVNNNYQVSAPLMFNQAPDFENPTDANGDNIYEVIVNAKDDAGNEANQTILVTVTNFAPANVNLTGDVNNARSFIRFNRKFSRVVASDIKYILVIDPYNYIKAFEPVAVDGTFNVSVDTQKPVGCIFVNDNNESLGYITLGNGIDSVPVMLTETDSIDFSQIDVSNQAMIPSNNPIEGNEIPLDNEQKTVVANENNFFAAMIKNADMNRNGKVDILEGRYFRVWPNYFIHAGIIYVNSDNVDYYTDDNQFFNGYKIFFATKDQNHPDSITFTGPDGTFLDDDDSDPDTISDDGNSNYIAASQSYTYYSQMVQIRPYPLAGDYNISYGDENLSFTLSDQSNFGDNVILIVPKVEVNGDGIITSISWEYKNRSDQNLTLFAQQLIQKLYVQIEPKDSDSCTTTDNGLCYQSGSLNPDSFSDSAMADLNISFSDDVGRIKFAYTTKYNTMYSIAWEVQ